MQTPDTLESLRQEYQTFKDTAARDVRITPKMLARATKPHISKIRSVQLRLIACGLVALVLWPWLCHALDLSLPFQIATYVLIGGSMLFQWWNLKDITDPSSDNQSLLQLAEQSLKAKRRALQELYWGGAAVLLWFLFFVYEIWQVLEPEQALIETVFSAVGGIVGFFIGINFSRRIRSGLTAIHDDITSVLSTEP